MLHQTTLHLALGQMPGRLRVVRVVVNVEEHDLLWANSAAVFDAMVATLEQHWRDVMALEAGVRKKRAEALVLTVPGVLKMDCELRAVDAFALLVAQPKAGGAAEDDGVATAAGYACRATQTCSHEIWARLMPG
jgi:hypothetical protein